MSTGIIALLIRHLNSGKFIKGTFKWLFTLTKDNFAIIVYNTPSHDKVGAVITADHQSKKIEIKKGGMDDQYLHLLKEHIESWAPHAEVEIV